MWLTANTIFSVATHKKHSLTQYAKAIANNQIHIRSSPWLNVDGHECY